MKKIQYCIIGVLLVYSNITGQSYNEETRFVEDMVQFMFGDNVKLREAPGLDSKTLALLPIGSKVKVAGVTETVYTYKNITSPWYKVNYKDKIGYVVGGLLSFNRLLSTANPNTCFLFSLSKKEELVSVDIRVIEKGKLLDEISVKLLGNGSFQFENIGNKGMPQLQDILVIDNDSEACGINGGKSYIFWDGVKLRHVTDTSEIGDGGLYHHHSEFIFPSDENGRENIIIYKAEHGELKDEETEWYVTTTHERNLTWDGEKLLPENYREE